MKKTFFVNPKSDTLPTEVHRYQYLDFVQRKLQDSLFRKITFDPARRREAALTSGVVPWNRLPTSFRRISSAKRSSSPDAESRPRPSSRGPNPKLELQPDRRTGTRSAGPRGGNEADGKKSIVVTLPYGAGATRPKTANFPARNFLAGYRHIPARGSRREADGDGDSAASSILMLSPNVHNGLSSAGKPDLDQMDDAELNQIFEELAAADDSEESGRKGRQEAAPRSHVGMRPAATELAGGDDPSRLGANSDAVSVLSNHSHLDYHGDGYAGGRVTPTFYRLTGGRPMEAGRVVQTNDNLVYVPRPKTRLCRVYVGTNVPKPPSRGRELEFVSVNRRALLHNRHELRARGGTGDAGRPVAYSTNFFTCYENRSHGYGYVQHPGTPDPTCIMCQQQLLQ